MLQTVKTSAYTGWPGSGFNPEAWRKAVRSRPEAVVRPASVSDIAQLYPEAVVASSDALAWQDIRMVQLRHGLSEIVVPPSDNHCLVLNLSAPLHISAAYANRNYQGKVRAGKVAIIPAGASWSCQTHGSLVRNMLIMYLRPLFVRKIAEEFDGPFRDLALTPRFGVQGKHIRHIGMSLLGELNEANVVGRLYADSLAVSLTMQLIKHYGSSKDVRIDRGGMAPHKLRKAVAWIDHHLARQEEGRVALRAVAKDVGLSYFHFSRAFKQSMGMTLTNYIAERRIERAKELMKETDLAISEIALRLGFSSQSHFTTSFRRLAGVTPRSFRHAM